MTSSTLESSPTESSPTEDDPQTQALWRGSARDLDHLRAWADVFDRSLAEEFRIAVRVHLRNHALRWVTSERGQEDLRARGEEPAKVRREFTEGLKRLCDEAYNPPPPPAPKSPPIR